MSKEIKVTGCEDCPFYNAEYCHCEYPLEHDVDLRENGLNPDNCPLKTESITVTI
jgi:hypothetical protein